MTSNYSIYSIPIYWTLAMYPHVHASSTVKNANNQKWNNTNPRGVDTVEQYKKGLTAEAYGRYERAEAAHKNLLENAPLFIGTVIIGNMMGLPPATLNAATGVYLGLRAVYIALYINTTSHKTSFLRSLNWAASVFVLFGVLIQAGNKAAFPK